jgi:hypothetical protein
MKGSTVWWFKKDLKTIINSFKLTIRLSPLIGSVTFLAVLGIDYFVDQKISGVEVVILTLIFWPISLLGFFMLHVLETKGYKIKTFYGGYPNFPLPPGKNAGDQDSNIIAWMQFGLAAFIIIILILIWII